MGTFQETSLQGLCLNRLYVFEIYVLLHSNEKS